jgi:dUTP pyrophosphatase
MITVEVKDYPSDLPFPKYETEHAAGMDLYANEDVVLDPGKVALVDTGLRIAIPEGYEMQIRPRSGLAAKNGITVLNSPGTIDADYRGPVKVILINHSQFFFEITRGMRIAQAIFGPVTRAEWRVVTELSETARGEGGFGSTGMSSIGCCPVSTVRV